MTEMSTRFTDNVGTDYQFFSSGEWYEANCGLMAGYMCKKDITVSGPVTVPSTEVWDSRCPTGYYSANYGSVVLYFSDLSCWFLFNLAHVYTCTHIHVDSHLSGNKCFKIVDGEDQVLSWSQAYDACLEGPGVNPGIASISNELENSKLASLHVRVHVHIHVHVCNTYIHMYNYVAKTMYKSKVFHDVNC